MSSPGLDLLLHSHENKTPKTAILTNQSGISSNGTQNIDLLLKEGFNITKILVPEHGLRGAFGGGEHMDDHTDPEYGLPVLSLYNEKQEIEPEKFHDIEQIIYDIQDVGARFYTYIATLRAIMSTISSNRLDVKLIIADRPAFLGDKIQGLLPDVTSFLSPDNIPIRYGLTCGELGLFYLQENSFDLKMEVIHMAEYFRGMNFVDSGQKFIPPSSAIRDAETALLYIGTCLLEGTDLSEGRGTDTPFKVFGRPGMKGIIPYFEGIKSHSFNFTPRFSKFKGEEITGFSLTVKDPSIVNPFRDMVLFLMDLHSSSPVSFRLPHFDMLCGGPKVRELIMGNSRDEFLSLLEEDEKGFRNRAEEIRIYS